MHLDEIRETLRRLAESYKPCASGVRWYLFGSSLREATLPNDVDILIIYESEEEPRLIRLHLADFLMQGPYHLTFLTLAEEAELGFIVTTGAQLVHIEN